MLKKILAILLAILTCSLCVACGEPDNPDNGGGNNPPPEGPQYIYQPKENVVSDRQYYTGISEVQFPNKLWQTPVSERAEQYDRQDQGAQAYFLQSVDYEGQPTYVFAFVGIPATATKDRPVPGVVLIHGGGGTAFPDWVKMWNDKGYAAIAIDTEGRIPNSTASLNSGVKDSFVSTKHHGPENTNYGDYAKPANQQFLYHAIAGAIVANSFLSSFEQVDGSKIGLTGISWGGVISTNAAAYDDRFAFVAPVYGAVAMTGTAGSFGGTYRNYPRCSMLWDDVEMLRNCRTPMLFVNWNRDPYFAIDATTKCVNTAMNARMVLIAELNHGHPQGSNIREIFIFADSVLQRSYDTLPQITQYPTVENPTIKFKRDDTIPNTLLKVTLFTTTNGTIGPNTQWNYEPLTLDGDTATFTLPTNVKAFYVTVAIANVKKTTPIIKI